MRVLALAGDIRALIAEIRIVAPLGALCEARGWHLTLRSFHECRRADLAAADVLVVQRAATPDARRLARAMRLGGGAVVYDIDDLLTEVPSHVSNRDAVMARRGELIACMREGDVLSVSTARLGQLLGEAVQGLPAQVVVPNHAAPALPTPVPRQDSGPVTILVASTERLVAEFLLPPLRALQDRIRLVVVGPPGADFEMAGLAMRREPVRPRAEFLALAGGLPNPLALVPLEASRFAAGKSAVKWFDYAEVGVPTLASAVPPYVDVIDDGRTGWLVPNTAQAWMLALRAVIDDPARRRCVAEQARVQVRDRHGPAATLEAWDRALRLALQRRAVASLPPPGWADWLRGHGDELLVGLRSLNRARLARRRRR
jgi:hypothetical protein